MSSNYRNCSGDPMRKFLQWRWCRKLCAINKLLSTQCPKYLFDIRPSSESFYDTPKKQRPFFSCRTDCFKYSFFPNFLSEWSQLGPEIQTRSLLQLSKTNFSLLQDLAKDLYSMLMTLKVLNTWLRLRFSHLNEHKFRHDFLNI